MAEFKPWDGIVRGFNRTVDASADEHFKGVSEQVREKMQTSLAMNDPNFYKWILDAELDGIKEALLSTKKDCDWRNSVGITFNLRLGGTASRFGILNIPHSSERWKFDAYTKRDMFMYCIGREILELLKVVEQLETNQVEWYESKSKNLRNVAKHILERIENEFSWYHINGENNDVDSEKWTITFVSDLKIERNGTDYSKTHTTLNIYSSWVSTSTITEKYNLGIKKVAI